MKRKLMSLVLALAMICSLFVPAMAVENDIAPKPESELKGAIIILHTNDVHGAIDGYAKVAAMKAAYEAEGAYVLLVDAGDFIQGDSAVNTTEGATAIELMNMAGYDLVTLGNHEFDFGYSNILELAKTADFPITAANVLYEGKPAFESNKSFTATDGTKIGFFGLSTPETATKAHPAKIKGVTFLAGEELYKCAQAQVDALKKDGCDIVVALGHLGIDDESIGNRSIDVLEHVTGIDLFIDGHSHSDLDAIAAATDGTCKVGETILTSTGTKIANVGMVVISDGIMESTTVDSKEVTVSDEAIAVRAAVIKAEIEAEYGAVFAKTEVKLNGDRDPGNRTQETNLGNLITDALLWKAEAQGEKVDAAITNGGGIRATIPAGDITKKNINDVLPFGNTLNIVKVTGNELLEVLEASTYCTPTAVGGFPQVAGITFSIDTATAFDKGELYTGTTYYAPASIKRITIDTVGGKAFSPTATYTIATNDFMAAGGDTYYAFKTASANYDLGLPMDEVVMEYIKTELNGVVTAEKYGKPAGNITIKYAGVVPGTWYVTAAKYVIDEGIMTGTAGGNFNPAGTVTRGTVYQMLYNMEGKPTEGIEKAAFNDIDGKWFANAAHWAAFVGIADGKADGSFGGEDVITRAEIAQIIADYAAYKGVTSGNAGMAMKEAPDYDTIPAEYLSGMTFCYYAGIMTGGSGGNLLPTANVTRDVLAQIFYKFSKMESVAVEAKITSIEKYGHAVLDVAIADFNALGYSLGDTVNVTFDNGASVKGIPYFDGYYVDKGEYMLRAYPGQANIAVCINYGKLNEVAKVDVGSKATITLAEKKGALDTQTLNSLKYTNERADYSSDEVFANFRPVVVGKIAEGVLYRSASPVNNENGRAAYGDKLIKAAGVATVLNLADTKEDIDKYIAAEGFDSPYYKGLYEAGNVIALGMPVDYSSSSFAKDLVKGIATMSGKSGPFLVHCTEGKDRAGFTSALLEALMGATQDEIIADYMVSYANYYGVTKESDAAKYQLIVNNNIIGMLETIAGVKKGADLSKVDWSKVAAKYLTSNGMTTTQVNALKTALSTPIAAEKAA